MVCWFHGDFVSGFAVISPDFAAARGNRSVACALTKFRQKRNDFSNSAAPIIQIGPFECALTLCVLLVQMGSSAACGARAHAHASCGHAFPCSLQSSHRSPGAHVHLAICRPCRCAVSAPVMSWCLNDISRSASAMMSAVVPDCSAHPCTYQCGNSIARVVHTPSKRTLSSRTHVGRATRAVRLSALAVHELWAAYQARPRVSESP